VGETVKVELIHPEDAYGWSFVNSTLSYVDTDGYEVAANTFMDWENQGEFKWTK